MRPEYCLNLPAAPSSTGVFNRLLQDEQGQDLIEYALLATFVSLVAIVGATALGVSLNNWYNHVSVNVDATAASAS